MIVAFLNFSSVVWTTRLKLPRFRDEVNNQKALFDESKEKKNRRRSRAKEKCTINKHPKQNKYLGVELFKDLDQVFYSLYVTSIIAKADPVFK